MTTHFLKASIIAALILLNSIAAYGCAYEYVPYTSWSAFHFIDMPETNHDELTELNNKETLSFWVKYTKGAVTEKSIKDFFKKVTYANLRSGKINNAFYRYLKTKSDTRALKYITECVRFNEAQATYYDQLWDYETPDTRVIKQLAYSVAIPASGALRDRYIFLKMRCLRAAGEYQDIVDIWNKYSKSIPASPLKERMEGYYAGALYFLGNYAEAITIFHRLGDNNSVIWCLSKIIGSDQMMRLYETDPNSMALKYALQDYMSYIIKLHNKILQYDSNDWFDSAADRKEYTDDLNRAISDLKRIASKAISDKRCTDPMVWATAIAFTDNIAGNREQALKSIAEAETLNGTQAMKENLERVKLWILIPEIDNDRYASSVLYGLRKAYRDAGYINTDQSTDKTGNKASYQDFDYFTFLLVPTLQDHFRKTGRQDRLMMLDHRLAQLNSMWKGIDSYNEIYNMSREYDVATLCKVLDIVQAESADNDLDRWLTENYDINLLNDMIGTRLLRSGKLDQALTYLEKVPAQWSAKQNFYKYLDSRTPYDALPFRRAKYPDEPEAGNHAPHNYKAEFCRKAIQLRDKATGNTATASDIYDYVNFLYQATQRGGLWAMADYIWSSMYETDELSAVALSIVDKALTDTSLSNQDRAKLLFARASLLPDEWYWAYFRNEKKYHYEWMKHAESTAQRDTYRQLANIGIAGAPVEITSCDLFRCYLAGYIR